MRDTKLISKMESCKWYGTPACSHLSDMRAIGVGKGMPTPQEFLQAMCEDSEFCRDCSKYEPIEI